jgi:C4-type Zn-finger protein
MLSQTDGGRCPVCHCALMLETITPHVTRDNVSFLDFTCVNCGPVKTRVVTRRQEQPDAR